MNKKIVVVSDNHGKRGILETIRRQNKDAYAFVHCGDLCMPIEESDGYAIVAGNNDVFCELPSELVIDCKELKIYVTHSHNFPYTNRVEKIAERAKSLGCRIACFGHTHRYYSEEVDGVYVINPGALTYNRDGSKSCYVVLTVTSDEILVERKFFEDY